MLKQNWAVHAAIVKTPIGSGRRPTSHSPTFKERRFCNALFNEYNTPKYFGTWGIKLVHLDYFGCCLFLIARYRPEQVYPFGIHTYIKCYPMENGFL